jgi:hypothetical protein
MGGQHNADRDIIFCYKFIYATSVGNPVLRSGKRRRGFLLASDWSTRRRIASGREG